MSFSKIPGKNLLWHCSRGIRSNQRILMVPHSKIRQTNLSHTMSCSNGVTLVTGGRALSIFSKFGQKMQERRDRKEEKQGAEFYNQMLLDFDKIKYYNLAAYENHTIKISKKQGATGWKSKMPGIKDKEEIVEMQLELKMLEALEPDTKKHARLWPEDRLKIISKTDAEFSDLRKMINKYESISRMWRYCRYLKRKGKPIPQNWDEMFLLMRTQPLKKNKIIRGRTRPHYLLSLNKQEATRLH